MQFIMRKPKITPRQQRDTKTVVKHLSKFSCFYEHKRDAIVPPQLNKTSPESWPFTSFAYVGGA